MINSWPFVKRQTQIACCCNSIGQSHRILVEEWTKYVQLIQSHSGRPKLIREPFSTKDFAVNRQLFSNLVSFLVPGLQYICDILILDMSNRGRPLYRHLLKASLAKHFPSRNLKISPRNLTNLSSWRRIAWIRCFYLWRTLSGRRWPL